jgi:putative ABC transport system ATP-binding protein
MKPIIGIENIWKQYDVNGREGMSVLRGVSFSVQAGEIVALLGKSGSGKTTLLNLLAGLDRPSRGKIEIGGQDLTSMGERGRTQWRRHKLGFVFQFFNLLPTLTVFENVFLSLELINQPEPDRAKSALAAVGLEDKLDRLPHELSGGEQQRVAIARALVKMPLFVLADEPTGNLDTQSSRMILELLSSQCRLARTTLIMASHSPISLEYAGRVLRMSDGLVHEEFLDKGVPD